MDKLADIRKDYSGVSLDAKNVLSDPIQQFEKWLNEALTASVLEVNAMNLATISEAGTPSSRIVLLKGIAHNRFYFYTNYQSQKGRELDSNPACALCFFWPELERQVRISGFAERATAEESDEYFHRRPVLSQLAAMTSPQSTIIKDRSILEARFNTIEKKFKGKKEALPRPKQWGGYAVAPFEIEFWQGRPNRLHDRLLYTLTKKKWEIHRLAP